MAALTHTGEHWPSIVDAIAPQGRIALIDDPDPLPDIRPLKPKSVSVHWESMFTRSLFDTPDLAEQGALLGEVAALLDAGTLRSTVTDVRGPIDAAGAAAGACAAGERPGPRQGGSRRVVRPRFGSVDPALLGPWALRSPRL